MNRNKIAIVIATAAIAIVGGSAYTAAITGFAPTKVVGAAATTFTGAAVTNPIYTYDAGKTHVEGLTFTVTGLDTTGDTFTVTGNQGATVGVPIVCAGVLNSGDTDYTCDMTTGNGAAVQANWLLSGLTRVDYALDDGV